MLWVAVSTAEAVGFGRYNNTTSLGQPLNFEAVVRLSPDESLNAECVVAEVFSGDNKLVPPQIRVQLEPGADANERRVRVRTTSVIDEPVVTVQLTVGCDSKTSRKFVAFIDPPPVILPQAAPPAEAIAPAPAGEAPELATASPVVRSGNDQAVPLAAARAPAPARAQRAATRVPSRRSSNVAVAPPVRRVKPAAVVAARPPARNGARLQLEAAPAVAAAQASAPAVAAPAAPTVAVAVPPAALPASGLQVAEAAKVAAPASAELLAKEMARLQSFEDTLLRVRDETQAAQRALAELQFKLKDAEAQRLVNPLVYALAAVCALLALAVAALWRQQLRSRNDAKWWGTVAPNVAPATETAAPTQDATSQFAASSELPEAPVAVAKVAPVPEPGKPVWIDSRQTEPSPDLTPEPRRDLSVEELIDLEQQAEFFVVLGQDDAAIDLLMGHVRSTGGISPLPYLKLLEIYRRRGDRSAYERIRERFNRRFNAYAPDWDADLQQGRSLEDYPSTIARLEALWVMPSRVMETLEASLFRRDETEEAFDLPAYRELLFLYAVARDFAHKADDSSAVDLLLPMDTDAPNAPVSRLIASMPAMLDRRNVDASGALGGAWPDVSASARPGAAQPADGGGGHATPEPRISLDLDPIQPPDLPAKPGSLSRR